MLTSFFIVAFLIVVFLLYHHLDIYLQPNTALHSTYVFSPFVQYILCAPCRLCYCCYYSRSQLLERDPAFGKEAGRVHKNELTGVGGAPAVMEMTV